MRSPVALLFASAMAVSGPAIGTAHAAGTTGATYRMESQIGLDWRKFGELTIMAAVPNIDGWKGIFTDAESGEKTPVRGVDSMMLATGKDGNFLALQIGARVCLIAPVEPQTAPRTFDATCVRNEPGSRGVTYRLTELDAY